MKFTPTLYFAIFAVSAIAGPLDQVPMRCTAPPCASNPSQDGSGISILYILQNGVHYHFTNLVPEQCYPAPKSGIVEPDASYSEPDEVACFMFSDPECGFEDDYSPVPNVDAIHVKSFKCYAPID